MRNYGPDGQGQYPYGLTHIPAKENMNTEIRKQKAVRHPEFSLYAGHFLCRKVREDSLEYRSGRHIYSITENMQTKKAERRNGRKNGSCRKEHA